jgi:RNA polymerase sigma-70 factor (ECF subfamily)
VKPRVKTTGDTATDRADRTDEQLVEDWLKGERTAFESLVRRHRRALVNHIYRHTGKREGAHDLAQDVFLKIYKSLPSFDSRFRFTTWMYRIASNCAIDSMRKKKPHTFSIHSDPYNDEDGSRTRNLAGTDPTPHELLQLGELKTRLDSAVRRLPADYRQLIMLRHRQHCRYDEIARITQLPIGTVKNRIFRAREMLRTDLKDLLDREV